MVSTGRFPPPIYYSPFRRSKAPPPDCWGRADPSHSVYVARCGIEVERRAAHPCQRIAPSRPLTCAPLHRPGASGWHWSDFGRGLRQSRDPRALLQRRVKSKTASLQSPTAAAGEGATLANARPMSDARCTRGAAGAYSVAAALPARARRSLKIASGKSPLGETHSTTMLAVMPAQSWSAQLNP